MSRRKRARINWAPRSVSIWGLFLFCATLSVPLAAQESETDSKATGSTESTTDTNAVQDKTAIVANNPFKLMDPNNIGLEFRFGYIWQGQSYPTSPTTEAPDVNGIRSSVFATIGGVGTRIGLGSFLRLEPAIEMTADQYVYKTNIGRAFPTQDMTGKSVGPVASVIGLLISVPVNFEFPVSDRIVWDVGPGLAFYPRLIGEVLDGSEGTEAITDYLNGDGRWLYPMVSTGFQFAIADWVSAGLRFRTFLPIWHAWDSEDLPFWDNLLINLQLDIVLHF